MGCFLAVAFLLLGLSSPKNVSEKEKMCDKVYLKEKQKAEKIILKSVQNQFKNQFQ